MPFFPPAVRAERPISPHNRPWRRNICRLLLCLVCLLLALPGQPGTDWGDFETETGVLPSDEAAEIRARIRAEIAADRAREDEERRVAQAEAERISVARAARPLGERLVEIRCLTCHDARQIEGTTLGRPGWTITVVRMEWLNGARLEPGDRAAIIAHLAARHPERNRWEWTVLIMGLVAMAVFALGAWFWKRGRWAVKHGR